MLDQKVQQAYQKITPSPELEQKILQMQIRAKRPTSARVLTLRRVASLAACAVLLVGCFALMRGGNTVDVLLSDGTALSANEVVIEPETYAPMAARAMDPTSSQSVDTSARIAIPLQFAASKSLELQVTVGTLMVSYPDDNSEELADEGQHVVLDRGQAELYWLLPTSDEDVAYDLTINRTHTVRVTYHAEQNTYEIARLRGVS